ncbi:hypothetical protein MMC12_001072 [Toensbergia leucococca]|nr:hypothetical protein [Toensbergia leucococca]
MHSTTIFALAGLSALAATSPTPAKLVPRACSTLFPTYQTISSANPGTVGAQNNQFTISQTPATSNGAGNVDTIVTFPAIPAGSYGCQLALSVTPVTNSGANQATVYSLNNGPMGATAGDTYSTYFPNGGTGTPATGTNFGTVNIVAGGNQVINSKACPSGASSGLSFLFEIADPTATGSDQFTDTSVAGSPNGVYLTYNC